MSVSRRSFLGTALAALASLPFLGAGAGLVEESGWQPSGFFVSDEFCVGEGVMMKFNRDMIVSAFGVNPHILGVNPLGATINAAGQTTVFFESRVKPMLDYIVKLHVENLVDES